MQMKTKLLITLGFVSLVLFVLTPFFIEKELEKVPTTSNINLLSHPIYEKYEFQVPENVIIFGAQPLYLPTNLITETMKRDGVLRKALSKLGMEIRFYGFLKGNDVNFFLKNGNLKAGVVGDMPALVAAATMDVIIPVMVQQGFTSIVANRPMLIRELKGKRIGYASGSNAHYGLLEALGQNGLAEKKVTLIPMEAIEMPAALANGKIDAFAAWEPIPTIALLISQDSTVIHRTLNAGYLYFSRTFSEKQPEAVSQIIAAVIRATRWMRNNRQNLIQAGKWARQAGEKLLKKKLPLSAEQMANLALDDMLGIIADPFVPEVDLGENGSLRREFKFMEALGEIPASGDWAKVYGSFDRQRIAEILMNSGKYRLNEFNYGQDGGSSEE